MRLKLRSILLVLVLLGGISPLRAQEGFNAYPMISASPPSITLEISTTSSVGAVAGALVGSALGFPFLIASDGGREGFAAYSLVAGLGAAAGSRVGGGNAAVPLSIVRALVGTAVGLVLIGSDTFKESGGIAALLAPSAGAVIGNRLGQR